MKENLIFYSTIHFILGLRFTFISHADFPAHSKFLTCSHKTNDWAQQIQPQWLSFSLTQRGTLQHLGHTAPNKRLFPRGCLLPSSMFHLELVVILEWHHLMRGWEGSRDPKYSASLKKASLLPWGDFSPKDALRCRLCRCPWCDFLTASSWLWHGRALLFLSVYTRSGYIKAPICFKQWLRNQLFQMNTIISTKLLVLVLILPKEALFKGSSTSQKWTVWYFCFKKKKDLLATNESNGNTLQNWSPSHSPSVVMLLASLPL